MEFFDSHCHFNDSKFDDDMEEIIKQIYDDNVTKMVCVGYNIKQSRKAIEISEKKECIYATCGISPNDIEDFSVDNLKEIEKIAVNSKVVAIGEIGLDYYWNKDNKEKQTELFITQIKLANKLKLPIVIHTREAVMDTLEILKQYPVDKKGIFHCCPLNKELIKEGLKLGYYISFSGNITFKNAKAEEIVKLVPDNRILIETDSPYLSPEPFRGKRNDSRNVKLVAGKIAQIKETTIEEIAKITYKNACNIYNINNN